MPYYVPVADTPEMQRVRENQKNFSMVSTEIKKKTHIFLSFLKKTVSLYSIKLTFAIFSFHSSSISQTCRTVKEKSQWFRTPQKSWGWRKTRRISARYGHLCLHSSAQKIEFNIFNKITIFWCFSYRYSRFSWASQNIFHCCFCGVIAFFHRPSYDRVKQSLLN